MMGKQNALSSPWQGTTAGVSPANGSEQEQLKNLRLEDFQAPKVYLKYIILPGFNTTDEDYAGTVKLMQELGISQLTLSPDFQHPIDEYMERKMIFEAARFKKVLEANKLTAVVPEVHFGKRRVMLIERFYRQM